MKKKKFFPVILAIAFFCVFACGMISKEPTSVEAAARNRFVVRKGVYYYYRNGVSAKGWVRRRNGGRYYFNTVTGAAKPGIVTVDGHKYFFTKNGKMMRGWRKVRGKVYYFGKNGRMYCKKLALINGKRYYFNKNGVRCGGRVKIGKKWYAFDPVTGIQIRNGWYTTRKGTTYFAGPKYHFVKGFYKPDDAYRYFRKTDGKMLKGWQTLNKSRYFFDPITGKRYDNCTIVYKHRLFSFDSNGKLFKNGWVTVNGKTYYAGKNGELLTGWYTESGNTYYFNSAGERQMGWISVDGKNYYLSSSTAVLTRNQWIDGTHYVGADGAWIPDYKDKYFRWPLDAKNNIITSHFGKRTPPGANASTNHKGIDIKANKGDPIYAAADGVVHLMLPTAKSGGAGNYTQILHDNGMVTEYMHQSRFAKLKVGQTVKIGQLIGYVGNTGNSYGAHLHFGIFVNDKNKNPLNYVDIPG